MDQITVEATINAPVKKVWDYYNLPEHIIKWNSADVTWHTPRATNNLVTGGEFSYRMEPKDNPAGGFDFGGKYDEVVDLSSMKYTMEDGRKVSVSMTSEGEQTKVTVTFDPENENAPEFQKQGWQSILNNFKSYTEAN